MSLISCPSCNSQISDKAKKCPSCGFLIQDYLTKKAEEERLRKEEEQRKLEEELRKQEEERKRREEEEKSKVPCPECGIRILPTEEVCPECGYPIAKKKAEAERKKLEEELRKQEEERRRREEEEKSKVPCPECGIRILPTEEVCPECGYPIAKKKAEEEQKKRDAELKKQAEAQRLKEAEEQNRKQQEEEKRLIEAERVSLESEKESIKSLRTEMQQKEAELQKLLEQVNTEKREFVLAKESFEKEMNERQSSVLQEKQNVAEAMATLQTEKDNFYAQVERDRNNKEETNSKEKERLSEESRLLEEKREQLEHERVSLESEKKSINSQRTEMQQKEAELQKLLEQVNTEKSEFVLAKESFEKEMNERQSSVLQEKQNVAEAMANLQTEKDNVKAQILQIELNKKDTDGKERLNEENKNLQERINRLEYEKHALQEVLVAASVKQNDLPEKASDGGEDDHKEVSYEKKTLTEKRKFKKLLWIIVSIFTLCVIAFIIIIIYKKDNVDKYETSATVEIENTTSVVGEIIEEDYEVDEVVEIVNNEELTLEEIIDTRVSLQDYGVLVDLYDAEIDYTADVLKYCDKKYKKPAYTLRLHLESEESRVIPKEIINLNCSHNIYYFYVCIDCSEGVYEWKLLSGPEVTGNFDPYVSFSFEGYDSFFPKGTSYIAGKSCLEDSVFDERIEYLKIEQIKLYGIKRKVNSVFGKDSKKLYMYSLSPKGEINESSGESMIYSGTVNSVKLNQPLIQNGFLIADNAVCGSDQTSSYGNDSGGNTNTGKKEAINKLISFSVDSVHVFAGQGSGITQLIKNYSGDITTLLWNSEDESIATINVLEGKSIVDGHKVGSTTLHVIDSVGNTGTISVKVYGLKIAPKGNHSLKIGETLQLSGTLSTPADEVKTLEWFTDDASIVSIDSNGLATAMDKGIVNVGAGVAGVGKEWVTFIVE